MKAWAPLALAAGLCAACPGAAATFEKIQLTDKFWSEGVAIGDLNRDGHNDVIAGPFWYEGPGFKQRHEIFPATETFPRRGADGRMETVAGYEGALGAHNAYSNSFLEYLWDFNGDGWPDLLVVGFPGKEAYWYENPGAAGIGKDQPWKRHLVCAAVGNESPAFVDLFRDGWPVLVCTSGDRYGYLVPDLDHPGQPWTFHAIAAPSAFNRHCGIFTHGLGVGDLLGNGRLDVLAAEGWWEQPAVIAGDRPWAFHRWPFLQPRPASANEDKYYKWPYAMGGAQMWVDDVNGDGRPDVISSLNAHGYGLAWFEQLPGRSPAGEIQFRTHLISGDSPSDPNYPALFSEPHAVALADIQGKGRQDIVTGKRFWAHGSGATDPDANGPAVLYWFELQRGPGGTAWFMPHLIDRDSGVGTQIAVGDLTGRGHADIAISNKKGTFVFLQR